MATFTLRKELRCTYDEALIKVTEALKAQGFGVLTEIDVKDTLKKKLDVDFRRYRILGACNPPYAHRALLAETEIGVMMPCNVIVYEGDGGKTMVAAVDPMTTMAAMSNDAVKGIAKEIKAKLALVLETLS